MRYITNRIKTENYIFFPHHHKLAPLDYHINGLIDRTRKKWGAVPFVAATILPPGSRRLVSILLLRLESVTSLSGPFLSVGLSAPVNKWTLGGARWVLGEGSGSGRTRNSSQMRLNRLGANTHAHHAPRAHDSNWNRTVSLSAQLNIGSLYVFSLDWGLATTFYLILVKIVVVFS